MASGIFYPAASGDDADMSGGSIYLDDDYGVIGKNGSDPSNMFFRFANVTIPQGAIITSAFIRLTSYWDESNTVVNTNIYFNASDDAVAPTTVNEFDLLVKTEEFVPWDGLAGWEESEEYDTPSLVAPVQEVVDRGGFDSGHAMMAMIYDDGSTASAERDVSCFDYAGGSERAELHVEWEFEIVAEPLTGTFTLSGNVIGPSVAVAAEPLELISTLSGDVILIPRTLFSGTLTLINSLKVGGTLTLINSLNVQFTGSISLINSILQKIEGTLVLKNNLNELAKFNGTLKLINHILDANSGITQGEYYFLKSHGI